MSRIISARSLRRLVALAVVAAIAVGIYRVVNDTTSTEITATFTSAEGLYPGDDVRVLGVKVGKIESVTPADEGVRVVMTVDSGQAIPADADAAIVSPSLVNGRFVQLSPAYTDGDKMQDGAEIGVDRTAVPVTFDDVKQQLTDLSTALGPEPGQKDGALARAIVSIDASLENGNSEQLRTSIADLREAAATLSDGRSDLFTTIANLNTFTRNLAVNDGAVRGFTTKLDDVGIVLARNRKALTAAMRELASALDTTKGFLDTNGTRVTTTIRQLNLLAAALADRSNELAGVIHVAPHSLIGLHNTIENQAITGRAALSNFDSVAQLICGAVLGAGGTSEQCRESLEPLLDLLGLVQNGDDGGLIPDLPVNTGDTTTGTGPSTPLPGVDIGVLDNLQDLLTGNVGGQ